MKALIILLILFELVFCSGTKGKFYRCGFNQNKVEPIKLKNPEIKSGKKPSFKRKLDDDGFEDLKIHFDFVNLKSDFEKYSISTSNQTLIIKCINKAIQTLESLLKALPPYNIYFSTEQIQSTGIEKWNETFPMFGDNSYMGIANLGIDLVLFGKMDDTLDDDVFGSGDYCFLDYYNDRPIAGILTINSKIDLSKNNSERFLTTVFLHEITHILGFDVNYIHNYLQQFLQKRDSQGRLHNYITSEKVIEVAKKYYKCNEIEGIELEDFTNSIRGYSHWDARYLLGEYMTDGFYTEEEVISEFTLAFLEGSGKYKVKYYTGGLMQFGKGKGCGFLENTCIDKSTEKTYPGFKNEFFDNVQAKRHVDYIYYDAACTSGRQSRAYHFFLRYSAMESQYIYFQDNIVGYKYSNGCPVSKGADYELDMDYYIGHCSSLGSAGDYGLHLVYGYNTTGKVGSNSILITQQEYSNSSKYYAPYTGETYSDHSFCYQSSLYKKEEEFNEVITRAVCYETFCSNRSLTIKIFDDYFVCPRQGGKLSVEGYRGVFFCPDYYLLCSGTVMCNDMYDCIEKKSETKEESYNLDYTPETNQILSEVENSAFNLNDNYELSDNGKCPKYCKMCKENRKCVLCKEDYYFLGYKGSEEIDCIDLEEINNGGYYQKDDPNLYYKCMDNCQICEEENLCKKCFDGYIYTLNKCLKEIDNCKEYSDDGKCSACSDNYAFEEDNREECFNIEENFEEYYTKDNGISYYPCSKEAENCEKCYYNSQDVKVKCYLCETTYVAFIGNSSCLAKNILDNSYLNINETHVDLCSNTISNCNKCTKENTCIKCSEGFYMVNDDYKNCISLSEIKTDEYYLSEDGSNYLSCNDSNYNDIQNCKKCSSKTDCSLCQETFTFVNGDKSQCVAIDSLNNKYSEDPEDISNYIKCENNYAKCDTCNKERCLTCQEKYAFLNDDYSICLEIPPTTIPPTIAPTNKPTIAQEITQTNKPDIVPTNKPVEEQTNKQVEEPTNKPVDNPTNKPVEEPTNKPVEQPTNKPIEEKTNKPDDNPTNKPIEEPTNKPVEEITNKPVDNPTNKPVEEQTNKPVEEITNKPGEQPTNKPIEEATNKPVEQPTNKPVEDATNKPVEEPTNKPIEDPTNKPVEEATNKPVEETTNKPNEEPTNKPVEEPTNNQVEEATNEPGEEATNKPGEEPTNKPVEQPTNKQIEEITNKPVDNPTNKLVEDPTNKLDDNPTNKPVDNPTYKPVEEATNNPVDNPTNKPVEEPTNKQVEQPTNKPVENATNKPVDNPTNKPVEEGTNNPVDNPTNKPVEEPTNKQVEDPTNKPVEDATNKPVENPTNKPIENPTNKPVEEATNKPVEDPTNKPVEESSNKPVEEASNKPVEEATNKPVEEATNKHDDNPTNKPVEQPTNKPVEEATNKPVEEATNKPGDVSTDKPEEMKTNKPKDEPTNKPDIASTNESIKDSTNKQMEEPTNKPEEEPSNKQIEIQTNKPYIKPTNKQDVVPTNIPDIIQTNKPLEESSIKPDNEKTNKPGEESTDKPGEVSSNKPDEEPTNKPNNVPTNKPAEELTNKPVEEETNKQLGESTDKPVVQSTNKIDDESTNKPLEVTTNKQINEQTNKPGEIPTYKPDIVPTNKPGEEPTHKSIEVPTYKQDEEKTSNPIEEPTNKTNKPGEESSNKLDEEPTNKQGEEPTHKPSVGPTDMPIKIPTNKPDNEPTNKQDNEPTNKPDNEPTNKPVEELTDKKVEELTDKPGEETTNKPNNESTNKPLEVPTNKPIDEPTDKQGEESTNKPNNEPTNKPVEVPTNKPVVVPTNKPIDDTTYKPNIEPTTKSNIEPTNKQNDEQTNKPNVEPINAPTSKPVIDDEEDEDDNGTPVISKEDALKKANISLSYEKINNFNNNKEEKKISYDLSVLTSVGELKIGHEIKVNVNLIYSNGTRSSEATESICTVQNIEEQGTSARATFLCTIENLEGDYYSLRYNNSESICGVPKDEISLDPVMTKKYKNNEDTKIVPFFTFESIEHNNCETTGMFTIIGKMSDKIQEKVPKFVLPLTYPEGTSLTCESNEDQDKLSCKVDRDIKNKTIIIEQTTITQENVKYFTLKSIATQEKLVCSNAILKESLAKINASISFRQVSHFNNDNNGLSFILIGFVSEKLEQGVSMSVNVYLNDEKTDRNLDCILENNVDPENGQVQGNFLCSAEKSTSDFWNSVDFTTASVSLSPNNSNIGGVAELDEISANPAKTDEEIKKIKDKKQNNEAINALSNVIDYYEEETAINTLNLESIDADKCNTTGKLTIKGSFLDDFEEELNFDLPLVYPNTELKCQINKATANTVIEIICKTKTEFKSVDSIVIEPRIIKKKNKELFLIQGKSFTLNGKRSCEKYDTIRSKTLEQRENSGISFSLVGALEIVNQALEFFLGLARKSEDIPFDAIYTFVTSLMVLTRRNLRTLEESTISDIPMTCKLNESLIVGLIGGYDCISDTKNIQGTPLSMKMSTDDIMNIAGIDNINLQSITSNDGIDYSNLAFLEKINALPQVYINNINGDSCAENGQYIIYGNISDDSEVEAYYSDIEIIISSTESKGLCEVEINKEKKNLTMICQNSDKFDISQIMIAKSFVKNSTNNFIFVINSYTSPEQFSCDVSLNSVKSTVADNENNNKYYRYNLKATNTNLSAGAIVAIIIPIIILIIALIIILVLMRKGKLFNKKAKDTQESTMQRLRNIS